MVNEKHVLEETCMKSVVAVVVLLIPFAAAARTLQDLNQAEMQNYVQQMQNCMAQVDQAELEALGQRSDAVDAEIAALCEQGKRDQAQERAIAYSREMAENPVVQQMKECGELAASLMPEGEKPMEDDFDFTSRHVCDAQNMEEMGE
jgi:hypothetical protein